MPRSEPDTQPPTPPPAISKRTTLLALTGILLLASALRFPMLDRCPVGLHQDEAANAWNAYCLLKTGTDQAENPWPVFCMRAMGEYRSALFPYLMIPFQAVGGMNLWTTRLPAACAGVLTVALLYWTASRLFGRGTGLAAALLLALNPVHIQLSRSGHEAAITPLLTLLPLAVILWAGFPFADGERRPRIGRGLLAGIVTGLCCYGYPAVRLYVPVVLTCCVLATCRGWWSILRTRRGFLAMAALGLGVLITFGPLAGMHILKPDVIGRRGDMTWIWGPDDSLTQRAEKVVSRHIDHFSPYFLFTNGDADEMVWTVPLGFIPWYLLPLQIAGIAWTIRHVLRSGAVRILYMGILLFPLGDALNWHISLHGLRTSAGLIALILPAAVGMSHVMTFVHRRRMQAATIAAGVALFGMITPETIRFLHAYTVERPKKLPVHLGVHADLVEALNWLRPHVEEANAVIFTPWEVNQPYLIAAVILEHDPERWHSEPLAMEIRPGTWDWYGRFGRYYFPDNNERREAIIEKLRNNDREDRVFLLLRPATKPPGPIAKKIIGPDGEPSLIIYDCRM